jgi:hypothetical protein
MDDLRVTIEHPVSESVSAKIMEARVGLYGYDGGWHQTLTVHAVDGLRQVGTRARQQRPTCRGFRLAIG